MVKGLDHVVLLLVVIVLKVALVAVDLRAVAMVKKEAGAVLPAGVGEEAFKKVQHYHHHLFFLLLFF